MGSPGERGGEKRIGHPGLSRNMPAVRGQVEMKLQESEKEKPEEWRRPGRVRSHGSQGQREFKVICAEGRLEAQGREARQVSTGCGLMWVTDGTLMGAVLGDGDLKAARVSKPVPRGWLWREGGKNEGVRGGTWVSVYEAEQVGVYTERSSVCLCCWGCGGGRRR